MTLLVNGKLYQMGREQAQEVLEIAKQASKGIYAIEKDDYVELLNEHASPLMVLEYEADGWTVHHT